MTADPIDRSRADKPCDDYERMSDDVPYCRNCHWIHAEGI